MAASLKLRLHGVDLTLEGGREDFVDFAARYLPPRLRVAGPPGNRGASIRVSLRWDEPLPEADLEPLGRWVQVGPQRVRLLGVRFLPGLQIDAAWTDGGMRVAAAYRWPSRRARWLARVAAWERARLYVTLIYYLVYFPWAWWLESERGWSLLHAAGLAWEGKGVLLTGLPGCGKSAAVWAALHREGWRLLSDNLLFVDRQGMWACPEPLHVDRRARVLGGGLPPGVRPTGARFSHGRENFVLESRRLADAARVRAVVLLRRGAEERVRRVDPEKVWRRLWNGDLLAQEWLAYRECAAAVHHAVPTAGDPAQRWANLRVLSALPGYEVVVKEGGDLVKMVTGTLERLVSDGE
ncbi:MAG TPA: hypothetical protein G4O00_03740 [Thermoflexia bacterium]|nr:hypothetical protein [Thermoflexia bacterium]